jgi:hypothetical protein
MDSRYLLPDNLIKEIQQERALLHLIRKNWMGLDSIHALLKNVIEQKKPEYGGYFGDANLSNEEFLNFIRQRLLDDTLVNLGIFGVGNQSLINEILFIQQQIELSGKYYLLFSILFSEETLFDLIY